MVKRQTNTNSGSSGGLVQSLMGMFSFNQVNVCTSNDQSAYCQFMRFVQVLVGLCVVLAILYILYIIVIKPLFGNFVLVKGGRACMTRR